MIYQIFVITPGLCNDYTFKKYVKDLQMQSLQKL